MIPSPRCLSRSSRRKNDTCGWGSRDISFAPLRRCKHPIYQGFLFSFLMDMEGFSHFVPATDSQLVFTNIKCTRMLLCRFSELLQSAYTLSHTFLGARRDREHAGRATAAELPIWTIKQTHVLTRPAQDIRAMKEPCFPFHLWLCGVDASLCEPGDCLSSCSLAK